MHIYPRDPGGIRWDEHYIIHAAYTAGAPRQRAARAAPDPLPGEGERRVHRKAGLGGKRIA